MRDRMFRFHTKGRDMLARYLMRNAVVIIVGSILSGCGTIATNAMGDHSIYSGTRCDAAMVRAIVTQKYNDSICVRNFLPLVFPVASIDLPLSFVSDTVLLPYTVPVTIIKFAKEKRDVWVRLATAQALFQERCKSAGVKIYRTAENVESVLLMKVRPAAVNNGDQFSMDDPYGSDFGGTGYIESFVQRDPQPARAVSPVRIGYPYVEAIDSESGKRYRYSAQEEEPTQTDEHLRIGSSRFVVQRALAEGLPPRYGVTYDDISTYEDRAYWIAGSSLKVIDLQTNEVMAERIGYMMDPGQGERAGTRYPWQRATDHACPMAWARGELPVQRYQTLDFVQQVLQPVRKAAAN